MILSCLEAAAERGLAPAGIGVATPGFLDETQDRIEYAVNLPTLTGYPLAERLRDAFDLPVRFDADCHAAALAEHRFGAGRNVRRLIVAMIGTGIGASVVIDGQVLRMTRRGAGMLGHVVVSPDGPRCTCGARGCLEALASARALEAAADSQADATPRGRLDELRREHGGLTVRELEQAVRENDYGACQTLRSYAGWLATGIAIWAVIFAPDCVVLGGSIALIGPPLIASVREALGDIVQPHMLRSMSLRLAELGADAGLIGAALIARCS